MSSGHNNTFFSNDGAGDTPTPRRPPGGSPPPPSPKEADKADSAPLTVAGIRALFDASWIEFHYLDTAETRRFFENWIKRRVTVEELEQAIGEVATGKETPTAGAVEKYIRRIDLGRKTPKNPNAARGKGVY